MMKVKAIIKGKDPQPLTHIREAIATIKVIRNGHKPSDTKADNPGRA